MREIMRERKEEGNLKSKREKGRKKEEERGVRGDR